MIPALYQEVNVNVIMTTPYHEAVKIPCAFTVGLEDSEGALVINTAEPAKVCELDQH